MRKIDERARAHSAAGERLIKGGMTIEQVAERAWVRGYNAAREDIIFGRKKAPKHRPVVNSRVRSERAARRAAESAAHLARILADAPPVPVAQAVLS